MGLMNLICFLFIAVPFASAFYPDAFVELARLARKPDFDSIEDSLIDEISRRESDYSSSSHLFDRDTKDRDDSFELKPDASETSLSNSYPYEDETIEREAPSAVYDDPEENDALVSQDYSTYEKRNDYYDNLQKKSQLSPLIRPPRKDFYQNPQSNEKQDVDASEEHSSEGRAVDSTRSSTMREYDDYYPQRQSSSEDLQADSHNRQDSYLPPSSSPETRSLKRSHRQTRNYRRRRPSESSVSQRSADSPFEPLALPPTSNYPPAKKHARKSPPSRKTSASYLRKTYSGDSYSKPQSRTPPVYKDSYSSSPPVPKFGTSDKMFVSTPGFTKSRREQFHEQDTNGPNSYKFGYNTGDNQNPMARYEERGSDGIVRGSYSFVDPLGKLKVVQYESHPKHGFRSKMSGGL